MKLKQLFEGEQLTDTEKLALGERIDDAVESMSVAGEGGTDDYEFWITILKKLGQTKKAQYWEKELDMDTHRNETGRNLS